MEDENILEEPTLEPIHPIEQTPYGAFIISRDVVCTPTSLCTWNDDGKPAVYCKLPEHTLNPICQTVNQGIGLLGCHQENTCGGIVRPSTSQKILKENPQYMVAIQKEEEKHGRKRRPHLKWWWSLLIVLSCLFFLSMISLVVYRYYKQKRRYKGVSFNQNQKRSTSRKI